MRAHLAVLLHSCIGSTAKADSVVKKLTAFEASN